MDFEDAHKLWLNSHLERRKGERKGRLERGHQHAEKLFSQNIWWELLGNLDHLHPEFEVLDWRGRSFFADFAWLPGHVKIIIEIKGFNVHVRDMDRQRYCDELNRETFLQGLGFHVISFAYDDVTQRPELCITLLRLFLSRFKAQKAATNPLDPIEKDLILHTFQLARPIRPKDVEKHLDINFRTAIQYLQALCAKGWLRPLSCRTGNSTKVFQYELVRSNQNDIDWII